MARRTRQDYVRQARRETFELELSTPLDNPKVVTFQDPQRLKASDSFRIARENDAETILRILLGDEFEEFWAEWSEVPVDELLALISDVMDHYGANPNS